MRDRTNQLRVVSFKDVLVVGNSSSVDVAFWKMFDMLIEEVPDTAKSL